MTSIANQLHDLESIRHAMRRYQALDRGSSLKCVCGGAVCVPEILCYLSHSRQDTVATTRTFFKLMLPVTFGRLAVLILTLWPINVCNVDEKETNGHAHNTKDSL